MAGYFYIHREILQKQQGCLVSSMILCTGCWDDLCWGPVDFWILILCQRVGGLHRRESCYRGLSPLPGTLRGINRHESTQMDPRERVKSPRSMSSVHGSKKVTSEASSAVGVVAS
jgi:hypothetical protein